LPVHATVRESLIPQTLPEAAHALIEGSEHLEANRVIPQISQYGIHIESRAGSITDGRRLQGIIGSLKGSHDVLAQKQEHQDQRSRAVQDDAEDWIQGISFLLETTYHMVADQNQHIM
jgi:hypothetical protein